MGTVGRIGDPYEREESDGGGGLGWEDVLVDLLSLGATAVGSMTPLGPMGGALAGAAARGLMGGDPSEELKNFSKYAAAGLPGAAKAGVGALGAAVPAYIGKHAEEGQLAELGGGPYSETAIGSPFEEAQARRGLSTDPLHESSLAYGGKSAEQDVLAELSGGPRPDRESDAKYWKAQQEKEKLISMQRNNDYEFNQKSRPIQGPGSYGESVIGASPQQQHYLNMLSAANVMHPPSGYSMKDIPTSARRTEAEAMWPSAGGSAAFAPPRTDRDVARGESREIAKWQKKVEEEERKYMEALAKLNQVVGR